LIFDDHIRSLAARQRLTKGRLRARHLKLQKIAAVLDLPANFLQASHRIYLFSLFFSYIYSFKMRYNDHEEFYIFFNRTHLLQVQLHIAIHRATRSRELTPRGAALHDVLDTLKCLKYFIMESLISSQRNNHPLKRLIMKMIKYTHLHQPQRTQRVTHLPSSRNLPRSRECYRRPNLHTVYFI